MKLFVLLFAITVLSVLTLPSMESENSGIQVALKYCTSTSNKSFVEKILTPRKSINHTTSRTSTDIYFWPNISLDSPLYVHVQAFKKFATQYKKFMIDYRSELCEVLKLRNHPLYKFFSDKYSGSNILDPCPWKGHRFVKPYYTSYDELPPLLPVGIWRIDITVTKTTGLDEIIFGFQNYYEITSTGIQEF